MAFACGDFTSEVLANDSPSPEISVDGYGYGATVVRPSGGSVDVTVRFTATDPDDNLSGIRYNIWHPSAGYFENGGGGFEPQSGGWGEVVRTVTLNSDGDWYFWTDAEDGDGAYASTGDWTSGFRLIVATNQPPTVQLTSPGNQTITVGTSLTIASTASDSDGNMTAHHLDIQRPDEEWNFEGGWSTQWPFQGGPDGNGSNSSKSADFTFDQTGVWHVRAAADDGFGWQHSTEVTITVVDANSAPQTNWVTVSPTNITSGQPVRFTGNASDPDSNLRYIQFYVIGPNGSAYGPDWTPVPNHEVEASGGNATVELGFVPDMSGNWAVHIRAEDTGGIWDSNGDITASFTVAPPSTPPSITTQPSSASAPVGGSVAFSVVANGNPAPTYQWRKGGVNIGATTATFTLAGLQLSDAGNYDVVVNNSAGSVTSGVAALTVTSGYAQGDAYYIRNIEYSGTTIEDQTSADLDIEAGDDPATPELTAVNVLSGANVTYRVASTRQIRLKPGFRAAAGSRFHAQIGGSSGGGVPQPPIITSQPQSQTVSVGATAWFSVAASGTAPLTYQWRKAGAVLASATNASLALNNVQFSDATQYDVVVSNSVGTATSTPAALTVLAYSNPDDSDGDGMSDEWERAWFLDLAHNGLGDFDLDGLTDVAEYNFGTNPKIVDGWIGAGVGNSVSTGWPAANTDRTEAVGSTPGALTVDPSGAATYTLPIYTPPGIGGIEPSLALRYSSNGPNGLLGVGWSLSGLSVITRGASSAELYPGIDTISDPADNDSSDRFFLDGNRLQVVEGGVYGSDSSEYRTARETFSKIVFKNGASSWFEVWTKSGLRLQYGNATGARFGSGSNTGVWLLNRVEDLSGNFMSITYTTTETGKTHYPYPKEIQYTGRTDQQAFAVVRFNYKDRDDPLRLHQPGAGDIHVLHLLDDVDVIYKDQNDAETTVRSYALNYSSSSFTNRSCLTSVQESGLNGKVLPKTEFAWSADTPGYTNVAVNSLGSSSDLVFTGDFNGDGRSDYVVIGPRRERRAQVYVSTGAGFVASGDSFVMNDDPAFDNGEDQILVGDVNGDGLADLTAYFFRKDSAGPFADGSRRHVLRRYVWIASSSGNDISFTPPHNAYEYLPGATKEVVIDQAPNTTLVFPKEFLVDIGGLGQAVLLSLDSSATVGGRWTTSRWDQTQSPPRYVEIGSGSSSGVLNAESHMQLIEVNGDGFTDFLLTNLLDTATQQRYSRTYATVGGLSAIAQDAFGFNSSVCKLYFGDFNGDGGTDVLSFPTNGFTKRIYRLIGNTWTSEELSVPASSDWHNQKITVGDFNRDGRDDLIVQRDSESQLWVSTSDSTAAVTFTLAHSITDGPLKNEQVVPFDMEGDGRLDLFIRGDNEAGNSSTACRVLRTNGSSAPSDVIAGITSGLGANAEIAYASLTDSSVYTKGGAATGMINVQAPTHVVKALTFDLGVGSSVSATGQFQETDASYSLAYRYEGLRSAPYRGVLGFSAQEVTDSRTQLITRVERRQDHPYTGFVTRAKVLRKHGASAIVLNDTTIVPGLREFHDGKTHMIYPATTLAETWAINSDFTAQGSQISSISTTQTVDEDGNVSEIDVDHGFEGRAITTTLTYWPDDTTDWLLGRVKQVVVTAAATGHTTDVRTTDIYYKDNDDLPNETISPLLVTKRVSEPLDAAKKLTVVYDYTDGAGHVNKIAATGRKDASTDQTRSVEYVYDSLLRFVREIKHAAPTSAGGNLVSTYEPDHVHAAPASYTDANDQTTSFTYDEFARVKSVTGPDNVKTETRLNWTTDTRGAFAIETTSTFTAGTEKHLVPPSFGVFDRLGRPTRQASINADGHPVWTELRYNDRGMLAYASQPWRQLPANTDWQTTADYDPTGKPLIFWTEQTFDALGRPSTRKNPNGSSTTQSYSGREVTATITTDYNGPITQTARAVYDQLGRVKNVYRNEDLGEANERDTLTYAYNASGHVVSVSAAGVGRTIGYDSRGLPTSTTDLNAGTRDNKFNAFGELYETEDEKSQITKFSYDVLGRAVTRVQVEGTTTWSYDTAVGKGKGLLHSVSGPDAASGTAQETYEYDSSMTRVAKLTRQIGGTSFVVRPGYDTASRVQTIQYESPGVTQQFKYLYNDLGSLREIRDMSAGPTNGIAVWSLYQVNAYGQPLAEVLGNGVMTSSFYSATDGALRDRISSTVTGFFEWQRFAVDGLGNVRQREQLELVGGEEQVLRTENYGIDLLNRVTSVALNGTTTQSIDYDAQGNITSKSDVGSYTYDAARPHAVAQAGNDTFLYDENGNRTHRNDTQEAWWTSFDQPAKLKRGAVESTFRYDADGGRSQQVSSSGETTYYIDGGHEYATKAGVTEARFQVASPTGRLVQVTAGTTRSTKYFGGDHLGSIQAITDHRGQALETLSYDAWGRRRNADWTAGTPTRTTTINRGYTGHEMLDDQKLVHMNGRVYDPVIARFLSVDPIVSAPMVAQTFNGYSYVANNPLSFVDPSGYQISGTLYSGGGYNLGGLDVTNRNSGSGSFSFNVSMGSSYGSYGGYPISPAFYYTRVVGAGSPAGVAGASTSALSYLGTANGGAQGYSIAAGGMGLAPNSTADAVRRYGEITAGPDLVGPPIPLTVKNLAAVLADAVAKAIVGAATIGNYADPPRGNLQEIGTGFGIARTAVGDAIGVDVNNPRFGVASDIALIAISIAGMPRGGQANLPGRTVTVFRVEGVPNARIIIDGTGRVVITDGKTLWVNIGQESRAWQYLDQKITGGLPGAQIKSFEVPRSFLEEIRAIAVSEEKVPNFPGRPVIGDPTKAPDQYGLRPEQVEALRRAIIQGTGSTTGR